MFLQKQSSVGNILYVLVCLHSPFYYMATEVCDWMCGVSMCVTSWSQRLVEGIPWVSPHILYIVHFRLLTAGAWLPIFQTSCPMSALLSRDGGMEAKKRDHRTTQDNRRQKEQEREAIERQKGKGEGVCQGGEWGGIVSSQNTNEEVIEDNRSNNIIEIPLGWLLKNVQVQFWTGSLLN